MNHEQINFLHHHPGSPVHQHNKSETLTKMQNIVYMYQQAAPAFENSSPTLLSLGSSDDSSCDSSSILSLPVSSSSNSTSNQAQVIIIENQCNNFPLFLPYRISFEWEFTFLSFIQSTHYRGAYQTSKTHSSVQGIPKTSKPLWN